MADKVYWYFFAYVRPGAIGAQNLGLTQKIRTQEDLESARRQIGNIVGAEVAITNWKRLKGRKAEEVENGNTEA